MTKCTICKINETILNSNICKSCAISQYLEEDFAPICKWCDNDISDGMEFCCEKCHEDCMVAYTADML